MVSVKVGDKAPDFTLLDVDMKPKSRHDFLGQKVVLAFFVEGIHFDLHYGSMCLSGFYGKID